MDFVKTLYYIMPKKAVETKEERARKVAALAESLKRGKELVKCA